MEYGSTKQYIQPIPLRTTTGLGHWYVLQLVHTGVIVYKNFLIAEKTPLLDDMDTGIRAFEGMCWNCYYKAKLALMRVHSKGSWVHYSIWRCSTEGLGSKFVYYSTHYSLKAGGRLIIWSDNCLLSTRRYITRTNEKQNIFFTSNVFKSWGVYTIYECINPYNRWYLRE